MGYFGRKTDGPGGLHPTHREETAMDGAPGHYFVGVGAGAGVAAGAGAAAGVLDSDDAAGLDSLGLLSEEPLAAGFAEP